MISLAGVRVLAVSQYGAGPWGTMHMADLGAEVIKIEDPTVGGDVSRTVPPYADAGDSLFFQTFNRNKLGITLNLTSEGGQEILHRLVRTADAVYSNLRGDLPDRLGLTYEHLGEHNPRIVCCHLTGYGRHGPRANEPAYDYLIQAEVGLMSITGSPEGPPERCGLSIIDFVGGITAAFAVVSGILSARESGHGGDIDVNLLDAGHSLLNYLATWYLNEGYQPQRMAHSAHPTLVPSQQFRTLDGYIVIMCNKEKFWAELCDVLGAHSMREDPRFGDFEGRARHREEVINRVQSLLEQRTTAAWLKLFRGRVPAAPVNSVQDALDALAERNSEMIVQVDHDRHGPIRLLHTPVDTGQRNRNDRPAPSLGQHTRDILREYAGVTDEEFEQLRQSGAV